MCGRLGPHGIQVCVGWPQPQLLRPDERAELAGLPLCLSLALTLGLLLYGLAKGRGEELQAAGEQQPPGSTLVGSP